MAGAVSGPRKEARDTSAILHLGNLVELLHVGKSEHNAQGIASFLKPFINEASSRSS